MFSLWNSILHLRKKCQINKEEAILSWNDINFFDVFSFLRIHVHWYTFNCKCHKNLSKQDKRNWFSKTKYCKKEMIIAMFSNDNNNKTQMATPEVFCYNEKQTEHFRGKSNLYFIWKLHFRCRKVMLSAP